MISLGEKEEINAITLTEDKLTDLLSKLKTKENGFSALLTFLRDHDNKAFAEELEIGAPYSGQSVNGRKRTLWEVPIHNRFFTGREALIDQLLMSFEQFTLHSNLQHHQVESKITALSACQGLGGVSSLRSLSNSCPLLSD